MKYFSKESVKIGDIVLIEKGKTKGIIEDIIDTKEKMEFWGVKEKGLMIKAKPFGLVFWAMDDEERIVFVERGVN